MACACSERVRINSISGEEQPACPEYSTAFQQAEGKRALAGPKIKLLVQHCNRISHYAAASFMQGHVFRANECPLRLPCHYLDGTYMSALGLRCCIRKLLT
eukprot:6192479-Pleurochrysis_carterae.AAC.3